MNRYYNEYDMKTEANDVVGFFLLTLFGFVVTIVAFFTYPWLLSIVGLSIFCNYIYFIDHNYISQDDYPR